MNKPMTLPRLACLTTLAAGSALMIADIANARQFHQRVAGPIQQRQVHIRKPCPDWNDCTVPAARAYGLRRRFVIGGQPANVNRVSNHHQASLPLARTGSNVSGSVLRATATKGNLTPPTTAHDEPPGRATAYAEDKGLIKAAKKVGSAVATASIVPPAASLGTAIIGHPGMGIVGTIQHGNPITGPAQETIDFAKEYTSDVANVIKGLW
jgi:hypothetical protein